MLQWERITIIYYVNILKFQSRGKRFLIRATNLTISLSQQAVAKSFKPTDSLPLLVARKQAAFDSEFDHNWEALDSNRFTDRCRSEKRWVLKNVAPEDKLHQRRDKADDSECSLIKCLTAASYLNLTSELHLLCDLHCFSKPSLLFYPFHT